VAGCGSRQRGWVARGVGAVGRVRGVECPAHQLIVLSGVESADAHATGSAGRALAIAQARLVGDLPRRAVRRERAGVWLRLEHCLEFRFRQPQRDAGGGLPRLSCDGLRRRATHRGDGGRGVAASLRGWRLRWECHPRRVGAHRRCLVTGEAARDGVWAIAAVGGCSRRWECGHCRRCRIRLRPRWDLHRHERRL
jgi:hypothetical protein